VQRARAEQSERRSAGKSTSCTARPTSLSCAPLYFLSGSPHFAASTLRDFDSLGLCSFHP